MFGNGFVKLLFQYMKSGYVMQPISWEFHLSNNLRILVGSMPLPNKIALVHDWLVTMRGGERVLEVLCKLFPDAHLFTLVHQKRSISADRTHEDNTSILQRYRSAFRIINTTFRCSLLQLDRWMSAATTLSSRAVARRRKKRKSANRRTAHLLLSNSPMRYVWDQYDQYFGKGRSSPGNETCHADGSWLPSPLGCRNVHITYIHSSQTRDMFRNGSNEFTGRDAEVMYPPVDVKRFSVSTNQVRIFFDCLRTRTIQAHRSCRSSI